MQKAISAILLGFILVFIEGFIVIKMKNYATLDLGSVQQFMAFWTINICLVYSIITWIGQQLTNRTQYKLQ